MRGYLIGDIFHQFLGILQSDHRFVIVHTDEKLTSASIRKSANLLEVFVFPHPFELSILCFNGHNPKTLEYKVRDFPGNQNSTDEFSMCNLHILLVYHCVVKGRVYFHMAKEPLHLFNVHPPVNGSGGHRSSELVGMDFSKIDFLPQLPQPLFNSADRQPVVRF